MTQLVLPWLDDQVPVTVIDILLVEEHHNAGNNGREEYEVDKDHRDDHDG